MLNQEYMMESTLHHALLVEYHKRTDIPSDMVSVAID